MQVDDLPLSLDPNVDYTKIAPVHQKHTLAFINQFTMRTVSFLNKFAQSCESRLMDFEYKLQKVEASLLILESQLSSINGLESNVSKESQSSNIDNDNNNDDNKISMELPAVFPENNDSTEHENEVTEETNGVIAKDDPRFKKFFKMVQFGVPQAAVKLKMQADGVDPQILDKPNDVIPGLPAAETVEENDSDSSSNW